MTEEPDKTAPTLAAAFARAQAEFEPIKRDRTVTVRTQNGQSYTFAYAPLDSVLAATLPALNRHGLALTHVVDGDFLETALLHVSGERLASRVRLVLPAVCSVQQYGSALTYARRYGVSLLLGVSAEEDDDGNHASGNHAEPARARRSAEPNRGHGREGMEEPRVVEDGVLTGQVVSVERKAAKNGSRYAAVKVGDAMLYCFDAELISRLAEDGGETIRANFTEREKDGQVFRTLTGYEVLLPEQA